MDTPKGGIWELENYKEETRNTGKGGKSIYTKKMLGKGGEKPYILGEWEENWGNKPELTMKTVASCGQLCNCI